MTWDVSRYELFHDERARPFLDLLARVPNQVVRRAIDLGCGSGKLTRRILMRWPDAEVIGVDSSAEMLGAAESGGRLRFERSDLAAYAPPEGSPVDLIVSNAALHWVDDHEPLIDRLVSFLAPGGTLAVQMPANFDAASHVLLAETIGDGPWSERLSGTLRRHAVHPLPVYVDRLLAAGLAVDAWETVFLHLLEGEDAVLQWVSGTALRPVLALLDEADRARFTAEYGARLRAAYPRGAHGTLFPFRRIFFVARRKDAA
jgi:trans-aconitate 2-methyltransferase